MKLWIDDTQPAPKGHIWCQNANEAIYIIRMSEIYSNKFRLWAHRAFTNRDYDASRHHSYNANYMVIGSITMACKNEAYHQLIEWLALEGKSYPIVFIENGSEFHV